MARQDELTLSTSFFPNICFSTQIKAKRTIQLISKVLKSKPPNVTLFPTSTNLDTISPDGLGLPNWPELDFCFSVIYTVPTQTFMCRTAAYLQRMGETLAPLFFIPESSPNEVELDLVFFMSKCLFHCSPAGCCWPRVSCFVVLDILILLSSSV